MVIKLNSQTRQALVKTKNVFLGNGFKDGLIMKVIIYALMIVISYVYLSPLIEIILRSFMNQTDILDPEVWLVPRNFTFFENYANALTAMNFWSNLFNSIWFSFLLAFVQTIISALAGYSFARYNIKGKKIWFAVLIVTFVIPLQVITAARFLIINQMQDWLGIVIMNTWIPQFIFALLGQGVYSTVLILICYNFFKEIPIALDEAAVMDGASPIQTFYHIIFKLSFPVILTVFLFSFVWNWNDIFSTQFYFSSFNILPMSTSVFKSLIEKGQLTEAHYNAGLILSILPLIILYLFVQKRFVEGIEQTGMTGQ